MARLRTLRSFAGRNRNNFVTADYPPHWEPWIQHNLQHVGYAQGEGEVFMLKRFALLSLWERRARIINTQRKQSGQGLKCTLLYL